MKRLPILTGIAFAMVLLVAPLSSAYVSINITVEPRVVAVPGVAVYYAPALPYNVFFYGGRWYGFIDGVWYYALSYRGPWIFLPLVSVPPPILAVPVEYYVVPLPGWHRGGPPPWARHRVEFREREQEARREFEREHRDRERPRPPAVQPQPREHREGRLRERREPQGQGHQELKRELPGRQGQAPPAVQPPQTERREHQEGRSQERNQHEGKAPRGPERGGGEHPEGRQEERR